MIVCVCVCASSRARVYLRVCKNLCSVLMNKMTTDSIVCVYACVFDCLCVLFDLFASVWQV